MKGDRFGPCCWSFVYHDLSSRRAKQITYVSRVLSTGVAQLSKCALQLKVQRRRSEPITKRFGDPRTVCCVPAPLWVFASIKNYRCVQDHKMYELPQRILPTNARLPHVTFQQKTICSYDHPVSFYRDLLQVSRVIQSFQELAVNHGRTFFAATVEFY